MLDQASIKMAAERLHKAEKTGIQTQQISLDYPTISINDAS